MIEVEWEKLITGRGRRTDCTGTFTKSLLLESETSSSTLWHKANQSINLINSGSQSHHAA